MKIGLHLDWASRLRDETTDPLASLAAADSCATDTLMTSMSSQAPASTSVSSQAPASWSSHHANSSTVGEQPGSPSGLRVNRFSLGLGFTTGRDEVEGRAGELGSVRVARQSSAASQTCLSHGVFHL